jgi:DivIVA domain-containing protein
VVVEPKRGTIDGVMWLWVIVIVALTGGVVAVAVGRGGAMSEAYDDRPDAAVPSGRPLTSDDLRDVRFSTAVRGYRMDEVDALLARLRADMISRESIPPDEDVRVFDGLAASAAPVSGNAGGDAASEEPAEAERDAGDAASTQVDALASGLDGADEPFEPPQTTGRRARDHRDAPTSEREPT